MTRNEMNNPEPIFSGILTTASAKHQEFINTAFPSIRLLPDLERIVLQYVPGGQLVYWQEEQTFYTVSTHAYRVDLVKKMMQMHEFNALFAYVHSHSDHPLYPGQQCSPVTYFSTIITTCNRGICYCRNQCDCGDPLTRLVIFERSRNKINT